MSAGVEPTPVTATATVAQSPVPGAPFATLAFAGATFLGAFLLFVVQPMIARYILPWFGGGAAVWTTCLLFFQAVLLVGYAYAHLGVARLRPAAQAMLHATLLAAAVALAVVGAVPSDRWKPTSGEAFPVGRILALLGASVGLPCAVLSATSPLLHAWYARVRPGAGKNVYRLYALSNVGSLLALLGYPFLFEPTLSRRGQATLWTVGLGLYAVLCAYCAWLASRVATNIAATSTTIDAAAPPDANVDDDRPTLAHRFLWVALPCAASVLLMATTNTMTQDLAPVPLLWVLPLALYLLTFILAFEFGQVYHRRAFGWATAVAALVIALILFLEHDAFAMKVRIGLLAGGMFVCCMTLHGELARLRPAPRHLTGYYLAIAFGGALGGLLVAVAAPLVLDRYAELHIGLWFACLLALAGPFLAAGARRADGGSPTPFSAERPPVEAVLAVAGLVVLGAVLWQAAVKDRGDGTAVLRSRDFYGALAVYRTRDRSPPADALWLNHGTIVHGQMFLDPRKRGAPTKYYTPTSGIGKVLRDPVWQGRTRRVGVVGLGAGTLAAFGRDGDVFRFYELSPAVARYADDPFCFLRDARARGARCEIVLGDGRIALERDPPQNFDVLVLDAFSGDAVPVHLLTAEAFAVYAKHLAPGGVVAINCTNRYVSLPFVLARMAGQLGWAGALVSDPTEGGPLAAAQSDWVILSPDPARLQYVRRNGGRMMRPNVPFDLWTDERTNLFKVMR